MSSCFKRLRIESRHVATMSNLTYITDFGVNFIVVVKSTKKTFGKEDIKRETF